VDGTEEMRRCRICGARLSRFNAAATCAPCERAAEERGPRHAPAPAGEPAGDEPSESTAGPPSDWLWVPQLGHRLTDVVDVGEVLRAYRATHGLTQAELAEVLGFTQSYVSRIEGGRRPARDLDTLKRIADRLSIPARELGLTAVTAAACAGRAAVGSRSRTTAPDSTGALAQRQVHASQRQWRLVRQYLNQRRAELSGVAARLYGDTGRVPRTTLLSPSGWIPPVPVDLADVELGWSDEHAPAEVVGTEPEASSTRPLMALDRRYERYTRAMRDIDPPTLFENRIGYRLLDVRWEPAGRMLFTSTTYFDMVDVCEAAAHELASACAQGRASHREDTLTLPCLPFRSRIGDPFDLWRRPVLASIDTLTIRRSPGSAAFILHFRDAAQVAVAGGTFHVMPAGMFQPASISPERQVADFDLWRNIMREYSEEFLGNAEHDGSCSTPVDYSESEPFRSLTAARDAGRLRAYCLGVGIDPLTLAGEILSVVVIDDEVFDDVFGGLVRGNSEGAVVSAGRGRPAGEGIPFTREAVDRLLSREPMAAAASACLQLAWTHRDALLTT
jgi:transcriptional regulator with XRE-family HTH domain